MFSGCKTSSVITNCSLDVLWVARVSSEQRNKKSEFVSRCIIILIICSFYYLPPTYVYVTLVKIVVNHAKSISPDNNGEREDRLIIWRVVGGELSLVLSVYWSGVECTARQWSG